MGDIDDTILTPPREAVVEASSATEDTIVRPWTPPPVSSVQLQATAPDVAAPAVEMATHYRFTIGQRMEPIALDVPAYIGRRPSSPRILTGVVPRLVAVKSPLREVSSTHIEVRQLGTSIIVTDMKSTNGSIVVTPGSAPRKLRQGESVVVSPGTLVDIGDGNVIEILPMQRLNLI